MTDDLIAFIAFSEKHVLFSHNLQVIIKMRNNHFKAGCCLQQKSLLFWFITKKSPAAVTTERISYPSFHSDKRLFVVEQILQIIQMYNTNLTFTRGFDMIFVNITLK